MRKNQARRDRAAQAIRAGREAARKGFGWNINTHPEGSTLYMAWLNGWRSVHRAQRLHETRRLRVGRWLHEVEA